MASTKTLTAQCFCKSIHFTITVPTASLPLKTHLCHCSVCRHVHGMLCCFHAPLPAGVAPSFLEPSSKDKLTSYVTRSCLRYFCSTCGCHIGDESKEDKDEWVISTSIFEAEGAKDAEDRVWEYGSHICVGSTGDGGLAAWLPEIGGRAMGNIDLGSSKDGNAAAQDAAATHEEPEEAEVKKEEEVVSSDPERLLAQCHCGGVSFTISRPDPVAFSKHGQLASTISPRSPDKYVGTLDFCSDCRLQTGTHVVGWTFVPSSATSPRVGPDLAVGTIKTFRSSPDVLRGFCGVCGATVFYTVNDRTWNDDMVLDVAVGVLRAPGNMVRAEDWIDWKMGKWPFTKDGDAFDKVFADAMREGMKKWSVEKYGEVVTW